MFGTVIMECKACKEDVEADLAAHGPGICIIDFSCGHTMSGTKEKTIWKNNNTGIVDLEEIHESTTQG